MQKQRQWHGLLKTDRRVRCVFMMTACSKAPLRRAAVTLLTVLLLALGGCSRGGAPGIGAAPDGVDTARWKVDASDCMRRADRQAGRELDDASGGSGSGSALTRDLARADARDARERYYRNCLATKGYKTD